MKHVIRASLAFALLLSFPTPSRADATTYQFGEDGKSRAKFVSDAPLETMVGTTKKVTGTLTVDPTDITSTKGQFKSPVASLRTGNDLRDEHLRGDGWLDAEKHPFLHFEITEVLLGKRADTELKKGKDTKVQVKGKFTAHGVTKHVVTKGTVKWSGDSIRIKVEFPVNLTDHQISVPSIVRLKVANEMTVSVDLFGTAQ